MMVIEKKERNIFDTFKNKYFFFGVQDVDFIMNKVLELK